VSIYGRLFLWFCAANLLTMGVSVLIAHAIFERNADRPPDIEEVVIRAEAALAEGRTPDLNAPDDGRRVVLVRDGKSLEGNGDLPRPVARHLEELTDTNAEVRLPRGQWLVSRRLAANPPTWLIVIQGPPRRAPWMRWVPLGLQILLSVLAIAGVGWVVARHLSQPLERIQSVTRRMAAGDLSSRVGNLIGSREDEYGRLARDFDRMAVQIETLVQSRDQLLHDVSHELRAPLSRLRFALELAREDHRPETLERADREIARIDLLVGELLALARLDQASKLTTLPDVDLQALAEDVIDAERPQAAHRGVQLQLRSTTPGAVRASADRDGLMRALENVIRNAVRHAPADSEIVVGLDTSATEASLVVRDSGPGVPADELPRLFEPFFRGKAAAGGEGYGLGLAIVARVMRAHRGRAEARNAAGGGLEVRLAWPKIAVVTDARAAP
jgi:two-component system OmpR family sensor kinase